jgi:hypothetical protein
MSHVTAAMSIPDTKPDTALATDEATQNIVPCAGILPA